MRGQEGARVMDIRVKGYKVGGKRGEKAAGHKVERVGWCKGKRTQG